MHNILRRYNLQRIFYNVGTLKVMNYGCGLLVPIYLSNVSNSVTSTQLYGYTHRTDIILYLGHNMSYIGVPFYLYSIVFNIDTYIYLWHYLFYIL